MTHASQYDFTFNALSDPLRISIERRLPVLQKFTRYVDVNLMLPVDFAANSFISYQDRPWEREAASISTHAP
jgi:hypothetical protein